MKPRDRQLRKLLKENGWKIVMGSGRHPCHAEKGNRSIPIPTHSDEISVRMFNTILKQAGIQH